MGNLNTTLLGVYNNIHAMMQTFWFEHSGVYIYMHSFNTLKYTTQRRSNDNKSE